MTAEPWSEAGTRAAYDEIADSYAERITGTGPELPLELAMIEEFARTMPHPRRTLDAGCGAGRMMPWLAARGCQVEGIDLSPEMVRRARHDHPGFLVQVGTLTALPHADGALDGVLSWYSTIHTPDDELPRLLAELRRVLRPGGLALFGFQTGDAAKEIGGAYQPLGHNIALMRFCREVGIMQGLLSNAGLDPVATLDRAAAEREPDGQGFVLARAV